ncbi:hypothetical protein ACEW7V_01750 [Areca yellow leaf disease phytoplasma]|uniref:hypothetical protein n=1 Tax=Areca yellow leaf disease phytoplasma TaxID=927614 RepID=UPI0035B5036E
MPSRFEKTQRSKKTRKQTLFFNPRNTASGTLRQLNSSIVAQKFVYFCLWHFRSLLTKPTQKETLDFLIRFRFTTKKSLYYL